MIKVSIRRWLKIELDANEVADQIPLAHNRKRKEILASEILEGLREVETFEDLEIGKKYRLIVVEEVNLGNRRYPYLVKEVISEVPSYYVRETRYFYVMRAELGGEYKVGKHKVVGIIKGY